MSLLYDRRGQPHEVPDDQVIEALRSGQYGLPPGVSTVPMMNPSGTVFDVDLDKAMEASGLGWTYEGSEQRRQRELQEQYGDAGGQALSAIAGAGRGLTFGLSDLALTSTGAVDPKTLRDLEEANPAASMAGELTAIGASIFAGGGAGLLSKIGTAPRAAAKLGLKAETAVAKAIAPQGLFGRVAAKAASVGTGSAIEGALYGGGQAISESALGDIDLTAENLLSGIGVGAALGGTFGAGLGAGFSGLSSLGKGIGSITRGGADSVVKLWERQTGNTAVPGLGEKLYKFLLDKAGLVTGKTDELATFTTKEGRKFGIQNLEDTLDKHARKIAEIENRIIPASDRVTEYWKHRKPSEMKSLLDRTKSQVPQGMEELALAESDNVISSVQSSLEEMAEKGSSFYSGQAQIKRILDRLKEQSGRIDAEAAISSADLTAKIHTSMDIIKRDIGNTTSRFGRMAKDPAAEATYNKLADVFEELRVSLEKDELFGAAAVAQKKVNKEFSNFLKTKDYRVKNRIHSLQERERFKPVFKADPGGAKGLLRNLGKAENDLDIDYWTNHWKNRLKLAEAHAEGFGWTKSTHPSQIADLEAIRAGTKELDDVLSQASEEIGAINQLKSIEEASAATGFGIESGAVGGFVIGGPVGAVAGAALGSVLRPGRIIRQLATLERAAARERMAVKSSVDEFIRQAGETQKIKRLIAPSSVGAIERSSGVKGRYEAYEKTLDELTKVSVDQESIQERLDESTRQFRDAAPRLAQQIQSKSVKASQFLLSKAPKDPSRKSVFGSKWKPSRSELAKFERYVAAAYNPKGSLQDLKNGLLTSEAVETLLQLYPKTYEQIILQLTENMDKLQGLPYKKRVQLSVLFDVPLDPTLEPSFVLAMQKSQTHADPAGFGPPSRARVNRSSGVSVSENLSASQRLASKG